jgi:hypothetical protein
MRDATNIHRILLRKPEGKRELETLRRGLEDTNKDGFDNNSVSVRTGFICVRIMNKCGLIKLRVP